MRRSILTAALATLIAPSAYADHSWGGYHWARTTPSFDLTVVNSTTSDWDVYVDKATSDWSSSDYAPEYAHVLNMVQDLNGDTSSKTRRQCNPPEGQVRICNLAYGYNNWLGIAGISIDQDGHIVSGYTKLNDSYFSSSYYGNPVWKQAVACQELGHNVGLDHQDEDFNNDPLGTCMDYQDPPTDSPNEHDYEELAIIYGHTDSDNSYVTDSGGSGGSGDGGTCNAPQGKGCNKSPPTNNGDIGWGMSLGRHGNQEDFLRIDPDGTRHLVHVIWTNEYVEQAERKGH